MAVTVASTQRQMKWSLVDTRWVDQSTAWANAVSCTQYSVAVADQLSLRDAKSCVSTKHLLEPLDLTEHRATTSRIFRAFSDSFSTRSLGAIKSFESRKRDGFSLAESRNRAVEKVVSESIKGFEWETDPSLYTRMFNERISIGDTVSKLLTKNHSELVSARDDVLLPFLAGVISEIAVKRVATQDNAIAQVVSQSSAMGFTNWSLFTSGGYDYREALMKMIVRNPNYTSIKNVEVFQHKFVCDVDDITDKGVGSVGASPTFIKFNRSFGAQPVVSITAIGSMEFVSPSLVSVARDGFTVVLKNVNNQTVPGNIHWTAFGY